jgi:TRAP transporter TAXI family solute receptor
MSRSSIARLLAGVLLGAVVTVQAAAPAAPASQASRTESPFKVVTASERGTYIVLGRDLATYVAPEAGITLTAVPSAGSSENVYRLRHEPGVKLALVQSDVYQAFVDQANAGHAEAANLIRPLRVVAPLYNEEIYFIARADSPLAYVHDIADARISVGAQGSGTALTAVTLYQALFHRPIPERQATFASNEDALVKLLDRDGVDVVVVVGGQPMKLLADMKPEARALIKLLAFDPAHPSSRDALETYYSTTVRATSYPNLLDEDLPALAVKAFLVTYDYGYRSTMDAMARFARSMCHNFPVLQSRGHPKWKDVSLTLPDLGKGWSYYAPTARELRRCATGAGAVPAVQATRPRCTQVEGVLGLCDAAPAASGAPAPTPRTRSAVARGGR